MKYIILLSLLTQTCFAMDAKEAHRISQKNSANKEEKCVKSAILDLNDYIDKTTKRGGFETCSTTECGLNLDVTKKLSDYFNKLGYQHFTQADWYCVKW